MPPSIYTDSAVPQRWISSRRRSDQTLAVLMMALAATGWGCQRSRERSAAPNAAAAPLDARDVRCVERQEGCIWCEGRGPAPPLLDPDTLPASICDPKDPDNCVDFCSRLMPECAVPWRTVPSCLLPSEL